jgi:hypothetical protein
MDSTALTVPAVAGNHQQNQHGVGAVIQTVTEAMGIEGNSFASGGLTIAVLGALAAGVRYFGAQLVEVLKKQLTVSAEFDSRDESYNWILSWLADVGYSVFWLAMIGIGSNVALIPASASFGLLPFWLVLNLL